jgi:RNA polymerase sigma-70 factor, ECF subfamily
MTEEATRHGATFELPAHLGQKLRDLFSIRERLPQRLTELLEALAAKEKRLPARGNLKNEMLALLPNLRGFALSLCGDPERADDIVQETILKAWSHFDSFQEGTNLRAWLFTILRNTFLSEMRKKRREVADAEGKIAESLSIVPAQQGHVDLADLRNALNLLPPAQREAVVLVGAAGMSYEEAAKIARCAVGTIKSRVNRGRLKLAEIFRLEQADSFGPDIRNSTIVGRVGASRVLVRR